MKLIKTNRNYKLGDKFPMIAEYSWGSVQETLEFGAMCMAFERRFGVSHEFDWDDGHRYNPHWRREINTKQKRRRIYFKDIKDWRWATLSK